MPLLIHLAANRSTLYAINRSTLRWLTCSLELEEHDICIITVVYSCALVIGGL